MNSVLTLTSNKITLFFLKEHFVLATLIIFVHTNFFLITLLLDRPNALFCVSIHFDTNFLDVLFTLQKL